MRRHIFLYSAALPKGVINSQPLAKRSPEVKVELSPNIDVGELENPNDPLLESCWSLDIVTFSNMLLGIGMRHIRVHEDVEM